MKKTLIQSLNNFNDFLLFCIVFATLALSFYVANSIQVQPQTNTVLGTTNLKSNQEFLADSKEIKYLEDKYQINLNLSTKFAGPTLIDIPLGRLFNQTKATKTYRIIYNVAPVYQRDVNAFLLVDNQLHNLLVTTNSYSVELTLEPATAIDLKLKLIPQTPLYYSFESTLIMYK